MAWLAGPDQLRAQTCTSTGSNTFEIPAQMDGVDLDVHCTGATNGATATTAATGTLAGTIVDLVPGAGNKNNWTLNVTSGFIVNSPGAAVLSADSGFTLDNSGRLTSNGAGSGTPRATVETSGSPATVFNRTGGTIEQTGTPAVSQDASAVKLTAGGTVTNETGATITSGTVDGVEISGGTGTVTNAGTISGNDTGVRIGAGGSLTNQSGGTISGGLNAVRMLAGGTVTNQAGGALTGGTGPAVEFSGTTAGTVITAGTITGSVRFINGTSNDTVELQPGFVMNGNVEAGDGTDTLRFGGTGTASFDLSRIGAGQRYQAFETFSMTGGTWTFNNATTVGFTKTGGTLTNNGTMGSLIQFGGTLMGTGTSGNLTIMDGILAPGNSIGTMTVNGNLLLNDAATLQVEVNDAGQADRIDVNGFVTISDTTLQILELTGTYAGGPFVYTIIDNDGADAVSGPGFASITNTLAFLTPSVSMTGGDGNDVVLTLTGPSVTDFSTAARTPNQRSAATGLNSLDNTSGSDGETIRNAVTSATNAQALVAFDTLSGEVHPSLQNVALNTGGAFTNAIANRLAGQQALNGLASGFGNGPDNADEATGFSANALAYASASADNGALFGTFAADFEGMNAFTSTGGAWITGLGSIWSTDSDGNAADIDGTNGGVMLGFDNITATGGGGFAAGYTMTQADVDARFSNADIRSGHVSAYGSWTLGSAHARAVAGYSFHHFDTTRNIVIGGLNRTATADYAGHQFSGYVEAGNTAVHQGITYQPILAARIGHLMTDAFTETGAGSVSLSVAAQESTHVDAIAGVRTSMAMVNGDGSAFVPQARAFYSHTFGDVDPAATMSYAGGGTFAISGTPQGRDRVTLGTGFTNHFDANTAAYADFETTLSSDGQAYAATAGFKITF